MEEKIAILGIFIKDMHSVESVNELLHEYAPFIVGRMGIPYRNRGVCIISIIIDAPQDIISALSGKLGKVSGVNSKTMQSK